MSKIRKCWLHFFLSPFLLSSVHYKLKKVIIGAWSKHLDSLNVFLFDKKNHTTKN